MGHCANATKTSASKATRSNRKLSSTSIKNYRTVKIVAAPDQLHQTFLRRAHKSSLRPFPKDPTRTGLPTARPARIHKIPQSLHSSHWATKIMATPAARIWPAFRRILTRVDIWVRGWLNSPYKDRYSNNHLTICLHLRGLEPAHSSVDLALWVCRSPRKSLPTTRFSPLITWAHWSMTDTDNKVKRPFNS